MLKINQLYFQHQPHIPLLNGVDLTLNAGERHSHRRQSARTLPNRFAFN